jgi:hypothetical protein
MLDVALKLLPEMVNQDMPRRWRTQVLKERLGRVQALVAELNAWERRLRSQHRGMLYTKKPSTWRGLDGYALEFTSLPSAVAFSMYTAVRVNSASLIANISDDIISQEPEADVNPGEAVLEALRWSRLACQCLEYFHTGVPKQNGRILSLWPLETAWEWFARLQVEHMVDTSQEMAWCRQSAERLAGMGLPPFQWR